MKKRIKEFRTWLRERELRKKNSIFVCGLILIKQFFKKDYQILTGRDPLGGVFLKNLNAIYIPIAKVANTSLKKHFLQIDKSYGPKYLKQVHSIPLKKVPIKTNYFRFAFVRNPFSRLVSCYKNKINLSQKKASKALLIYPGIYPKMSFKKFILAINKIPRKQMEGHFALETDYLFTEKGKKKVDFIGKFENLEKDMKKLYKKLKIINPPKLEFLNSTKKDNYKNYYTPELIRIVEKKYALDLKNFNYTF